MFHHDGVENLVGERESPGAQGSEQAARRQHGLAAGTLYVFVQTSGGEKLPGWAGNPAKRGSVIGTPAE